MLLGTFSDHLRSSNRASGTEGAITEFYEVEETGLHMLNGAKGFQNGGNRAPHTHARWIEICSVGA
jgi:hypothetical protein